MIHLNRQEGVAVLFLVGALLVGAAVAWVDARDPSRLEDFHVIPGAVAPPSVPEVEMEAVAVVSLNRAGVVDLEALPGVGPKTAAAIVAYRQAHGPFHAVDDLVAVRGIGPATVARLRDRVSAD